MSKNKIQDFKIHLEKLNYYPEIYKIVDPYGNGELIDLMRLAIATKDYSRVDSYIKNLLPNYLYNNGEGKLV